jgi:hypothetical protein
LTQALAEVSVGVPGRTRAPKTLELLIKEFTMETVQPSSDAALWTVMHGAGASYPLTFEAALREAQDMYRLGMPILALKKMCADDRLDLAQIHAEWRTRGLI